MEELGFERGYSFRILVVFVAVLFCFFSSHQSSSYYFSEKEFIRSALVLEVEADRQGRETFCLRDRDSRTIIQPKLQSGFQDTE